MAPSSLAGHDEVVARNLGTPDSRIRHGGTQHQTRTGGGVTGPAWRDPRLWIGHRAGGGERVVGAGAKAPPTTPASRPGGLRDLGAGQRVKADDLVAQRCGSRRRAGGYFTVDDELPADLERPGAWLVGGGAPKVASVRRTRPAWSSTRGRRPEPSRPARAWRRGRHLRRGADQCRHRGRGPAGRTRPDRATVVDAPERRRRSAPAASARLVLAVPGPTRQVLRPLARYDGPSLTVVRRG